MGQKADVVIIGGGVIGICTAYYLQKAGRQVILLERDEICSGSSYGNSGLIVPSHSIPLPAPGVVFQALKWMFNPESPFYIKPRLDLNLMSWLLRFTFNCTSGRMFASVKTLVELSRASRVLYDQLISEESIRCNYETSGLLMVYRTEEGYEEGVHEGKLMRDAGLPSKEMKVNDLIKMEPGIRSDIFGGIYYSEDAFLNPSEFVTALAQVVRDKGVDIREGIEVIGLDTNSINGIKVKTGFGDYTCNEVVLAAGSWSPGILNGQNINLPVEPAKGYSVTFDTETPLLKHALILGEAKIGVNPLGRNLRLAGTLELAGLDLSVSTRRVNAVVNSAKRYLNGGDKFTADNVWAGLRPVTPDGVPIIGRLRSHPNVLVATGHATIGMTLGPITGKLVTEILCNKGQSIDTGLFTPSRFGI